MVAGKRFWVIPSEELTLPISELGYWLASALHDPESDDENEGIRHAIEKMHFDDVMQQALRSGELQPRAPSSGLPMIMATPTSVITVKDLERLLEDIQCNVQIQRSPNELEASKASFPLHDGVTYSWPMFERLQPYSEWRGGRMADTDVLTLEDAASFATKHAGEDVTLGDFLRAAGRGEIVLRAIVHRTAKVRSHDGRVFCNKGERNENVVPAGCIATLPLSACQHLAHVGRARWRTFDGFEEVEAQWVRFTKGTLTEDEEDFETVPADCRITGNDVHALADAFCESSVAPESTAAPKQGALITASLSNSPLPLTTGDIAFCFDGIRWSEKAWRKPLGDKPKWLERCIAIPGRQGVSETRWNPVLIAAALVVRGEVQARTVRARFQTKHLLSEWREGWKIYEAEHFDND